MAISTVEASGFTAYCDEYLCSEKWSSSNSTNKYYSCWFLSLFGAPVALRAIWATLIKGMAGAITIIPTQEEEDQDRGKAIIASIGREGVSWRSHGPRKLPNAYNAAHMIIYNKMFEVEHKESNNFLIISRNLEQTVRQHYQHLNYQSEIPLHESWRDYLWHLTQEEEWGTPLFGHDIAGWYIRPDYGHLEQRIQEDITSGLLRTAPSHKGD